MYRPSRNTRWSLSFILVEKVLDMDFFVPDLDRYWKVCKYHLKLVRVALFDSVYHALDNASRGVCHCQVALARAIGLDCHLVALDSHCRGKLCKVLLDSSKLAFYGKHITFLGYFDACRRLYLCHYFLLSRRSQPKLLPSFLLMHRGAT